MTPGHSPTDENARRCGVFAIIGAPNAGKSTLVNALVGAKVAIVSPKAQTTRARLRGVAIEGAAQLILIDTPGVFAPVGKGKARRLDKAMVAAAWEGASEADAVIMALDAPAHRREGRARDEALAVVDRLAGAGRRAILAVNKIDAAPREALLKLVHELDQTGAFAEVFLISAKTGDGVGDLKTRLADLSPPGPWLFPEDQLTDISERLMAAEMTREQVFLKLRQELPYSASVETEDWRETRAGARIEQTIYVERESQKGIVVGKGGAMLRAIGEAARAEIAAAIGKPAHLFLHVKVRERWAEEAARLRAIGLEPG